MDCPAQQRRHNPVDSICRKLQSIQRHDRSANSPFHIPKLSSSSYDSPQSGLRHNLDTLLKRRAFGGQEEGGGGGGGGGGEVVEEEERTGMLLTPAGSPRPPRTALYPSTPYALTTPASTRIPHPANTTYTITGTLGERRSLGPAQGRGWPRSCSTPAGQTADGYFGLSRGPQLSQLDRAGPESEGPGSSAPHVQTHVNLLSYNLNFSSAGSPGPLDSDLPFPALVVKRLSMGDGATFTSDTRKETMAEVSLICEEDLLDTIFHACDTQRRGKVFVSRIVDYLRHTTSRGSEDSGLEELCNMLDPERKDVSIDLDTYHAVMKEWIDDCRNSGDDPAEDLTKDSIRLKGSLAARRSALLNLTSGSLEAFGGEASRADLETSDLMYCVADLQFSNQKLQEDVQKLKQAMEAMEDTNQRLSEENEQLRSQAKLGNQLAQKEKLLKDEVEEMKVTLSSTEEGRTRASEDVKRMERENHILIVKIASLQEENIKITMEMDIRQKRMMELCDLNSKLQAQVHSSDAIVAEKEFVLLELNRQIDELKATVEEYSSVTELLRADKAMRESQMLLMQTDMAAAGLSFSVAYRLNQSISGSLQTELALAQSPLEGLCANLSFASPFDETLDREVLLLLQGPNPQGPNPEQTSLESKTLISKLKRDFREEGLSLLSTIRGLLDQHGGAGAGPDTRIVTVQRELDTRRTEWALSLEQLDQYTDSLEKELIKMAGNLRRSRTEILHLSVRVQEQENQKQQLKEELDKQKIRPPDSRQASCQTPTEEHETGVDLDWDEDFALQDFLHAGGDGERYRGYRAGAGRPDRRTDKGEGRERDDAAEEEEEEEEEERWAAVGVEGGPEGPRGTSSHRSPLRSTPPGQSAEEEEAEAAALPEPDLKDSGEAIQRAKLPACTGLADAHPQAVGGDALALRSHSEEARDAVTLDPASPLTEGPTPNLSASPDHDRTITPGHSPPGTWDVVSPSCTSPLVDETITLRGSSQPTGSGEGHGESHAAAAAAGGGRGGGGGGEDDTTTASMDESQRPSQDQLTERAVAEDSASLLPVLEEEEEEEECGQEPVEVVTVEVDMAGNGKSPQTEARVTSDPKLKKEPDPPGGGAGAAEERRAPHDDLSESSVATTEKDETSAISEDTSDSREERNSLSPSEKEIETEFQRLSLSFKCDLFTLEKRLRLEERSRDLAEDNVRREVSSCQGLLQALIPLCEDDNQSMEIIQRLQKNLDILVQSMTRVSSRSETLGAIHQENRVGKAVEVMIHHVENLRRMYTKEHAELMELRENLMQNERSFGSLSDRDPDYKTKKQLGSQFYGSKSTARRVSMPTVRHLNMSKTQDATETDAERLTRRSPWNVTGKSTVRPPLKRFVTSGAWADVDEHTLVKGSAHDTDSHSEDERREEPQERRSSLSELGNKLTSLIMPLKTSGHVSCPTAAQQAAAASSLGPSPSRPAVRGAVRGAWLWLALVVVLAGLLALLASLVMQPAVDAAPTGTGDSWTTIQQLLWPYTGLRHNGQPPV